MTRECLLSLAEVRIGWKCLMNTFKWIVNLNVKINRQLLNIKFAGGSAMKAAETLREEGFKGKKESE